MYARQYTFIDLTSTLLLLAMIGLGVYLNNISHVYESNFHPWCHWPTLLSFERITSQ